MKNTKVLTMMGALILAFAFSTSLWAHEGHDHDAPPAATAPKGGILRSLEETSVEVVSRGNDLKIYIYDKNLKPKSIAGFVVLAKAEMPRTKKQESINLTSKENHFEASYDAKGIHRYTLLLSVKDPKTGHDDKLTFTIEPKK